MTVKIGLLLAELQGQEAEWARIWRNCVELAIATSPDLVQPIETIERNVNGLPWGGAHEVTSALRELEAEGVLAVLGPSNADNCKSVLATANELQLPTFPFGCSHQLATEWTYSLAWGSAPVDAFLAMNWVARQGYRRAVILGDTAWHAREWLDYLHVAGQRFGVRVVGSHMVTLYAGFEGHLDRQVDDAREGVEFLRQLDADVLIMASSVSAERSAMVVHESGWEIPKVKAGAAFGGSPHWEGWVGTALYDDANPTYRAWAQAYEERFGPAPTGSLLDMALSFGDAVRALLEGIRLAPVHNRTGLRDGLDRVKMLPALAGGPGTVIGFGPYDHRGYKGHDTSVLQRYVGPGPADFRFEGYYETTSTPVGP